MRFAAVLVIALLCVLPQIVTGAEPSNPNFGGYSGSDNWSGAANPTLYENTDEIETQAVVEYADGGLVTCQGPDCDACDLVKMVNKVVNYLIVLLTVLATFVLVIAGFRMVTAGGNASAWEGAKQSFFNIVIGFILVLAAWLIVDTILKALTGAGLEVWGVITC